MIGNKSAFSILAYNTNLSKKPRNQTETPVSAPIVTVPDFFQPSSSQKQPVINKLDNIEPSPFCLLVPESHRRSAQPITLALSRKFSDGPTPVQAKVVPLFFPEASTSSASIPDISVIAPTGSGKTLAYLLGILNLFSHTSKKGKSHNVKSIIVLPTRELARQVYSVIVPLLQLLLPRLKVSIQLLNKSTINSILDSPPDIIVSVPSDLLLKLDSEKLSSVQLLVLDEWDSLQDSQFKEVMDQFLARLPVQARRAMFSATSKNSKPKLKDEGDTKSLVESRPEPLKVNVKLPKAERHKVEHQLVFTGSEDGKLLAFSSLVTESQLKPPTLIFVQSTERANALFVQLSINVNLRVDVIHASLSNSARDTAIDRFLSGQTWVLITTDLLARGIDYQGVFQVINYDLPLDASAYLHRAGRTGRAGRGGEVISYFTKSDAKEGRLKTIANVLKNAGVEIPDFISNLRTTSHIEKQKLRHTVAKRSDIGGTAAKIGQREGRKRKEIVLASKRRKLIKENIEKQSEKDPATE